MRRHINTTALLLSAMVMMLCPSVNAGWLLQPGLGGSLTDVGLGLGGSLDVRLRGYWLPVPEVGIGLSASALFPLPGNGHVDEADRTRAVIWAGPEIILRFGDDSSWGFTRAGIYASGSIASDTTESSLVASLGGGFVVAPRVLPFHFGFEIDAALGLTDGATVRTIGLGGFVGWTF